MSGEVEATPPREGARFRAIVGLVALLSGVAGMLCLFFIPIPEGNREAAMLVLGVVLGWGGTVVSYEYGSSPSGRKAADAGIKKAAGEP